MVTGIQNEPRAGAVIAYHKLEYRRTRKFHLRDEGEPVMRFEGDHTPEIDRVTYAKLSGMTPTAAHADPAEGAVEDSTHPPECIEI
jgi:hypothetical protein